MEFKQLDLKQIEKLMASMGRAGMRRISLKLEGFELELEKEGTTFFQTTPSPSSFISQSLPATPRQEEERAPAEQKEQAGGKYVTSPMVGTFFSAPSPEDPPYIKVGQEIDENTVVCIIEAMKVMNEVKANVRGKVVEILVKNGDPVEYGTKIIRVL